MHPMLELARDPAWQAFGAVIALLAIVATFVIFRLQTRIKELAVGRVSSRRLLSIADEVSARVSVRLDGQPVTNLHLVVYGIKNSGHRAIAATDFVRPLVLSYEGGKIVSAEVSYQLPSNLNVKLRTSLSQVEIESLLLNSGDQFHVQLLVSASAPDALIDARIVDVPHLVPANTRPSLPPFLKSGLPLAIGALGLLGGMVGIANNDLAVVYGTFMVIVFIILYGLTTRLIENSGRAARRRINGL